MFCLYLPTLWWDHRECSDFFQTERTNGNIRIYCFKSEMVQHVIQIKSSQRTMYEPFRLGKLSLLWLLGSPWWPQADDEYDQDTSGSLSSTCRLLWRLAFKQSTYRDTMQVLYNRYEIVWVTMQQQKDTGRTVHNHVGCFDFLGMSRSRSWGASSWDTCENQPVDREGIICQMSNMKSLRSICTNCNSSGLGGIIMKPTKREDY